jgi:tetratricopeptide (TPR) repeat protein
MRTLLLSLVLGLLFHGVLGANVQENNRAVKLLETGHYLEGLALLQKAQQQQPYDEVIRANLLKAYTAAAQALVSEQRYEEALPVLYEAQRFDDSQRAFWIMRGYSFLRLKKYSEAEVELLEARGMGAPDANILFMLGQLYYNTDRMYEAFDVLESADLYDSGNQAVEQMLAKVRRELAVEKKMDKEYGGQFVITFEGEENKYLGSEVLDVLEDAYNWVGSRLGHYPEQRVTVILYSQRQFSELTNSPDWAGGLYDGKIRLPVGGIATVDDRVQGLLYHEYMHVVVRDIVGAQVPTWLNEGLAEMSERQVKAKPLQILASAIQQDKLIPFETLERPFNHLRGPQVLLAYEQSYDMVRFLIDRYGWHNVRDLLFALRDNQTFFGAIETVLGIDSMTYKSLQRRWLAAG